MEPSNAMNENLDAQIGELVHQALWRARATQTDLAQALNVDQGSVSRRLRGRIAWRVSDLMAAGRLCGVDWMTLVPGAGGLPRLDSNQQPAGYGQVVPFRPRYRIIPKRGSMSPFPQRAG